MEEFQNNNQQYSPLLHKVRQNFGIFGGISFIFGIAFTVLFYKTGLGINVFLFTVLMVYLLKLTMNKLELPIKKGTMACYYAVILLGLSSILTSSWTLHFFNLIGIICLLEISIINQIYTDVSSNIAKQLGRMFHIIIYGIASIWMPFSDSFHFLGKTKVLKNEKARNITLGVIISLPLLFIMVGLLSSADLVFGKLTERVFDFFFSTSIFSISFMFLFGFISCYCIICGATYKVGLKRKESTEKRLDPSIAITMMSLLGIVYVLFSLIQITYLFANGLFVLPEEFTFSEYARRGFFELVTVTVINISLIIICTTFFRKSKVLNLILASITICTYIMIASATYRMLLYIGVYHLTFLRLFVLLFLLIDAFLLAGVIISVYRKEFPLFGYAVSVITIFYLMFSFSRPDYYIASYLLEYKNELDRDDISYLTNTLSKDAASVVLPLISETLDNNSKYNNSKYNNSYDNKYGDYSYLRNEYYKQIENEKKRRNLRDFNLSYYNAARYVKTYPNPGE